MLRVLVLMAAALLMLVAPASAQGFAVQPMRIDTTPRAGQTIEIPFEVNNTSVSGARTVELTLVELSQTSAGIWQPLVHDPASSATPGASAYDWINVADGELLVPAAARASTTVSIRVPRDARGTYVAALLAETPVPPSPNGLVVRVRFLIPIIVRIEGRPVRQEVRLEDVSLALEGDEAQPQERTARGYLTISNQGRTYSRIRGQLVLESRFGDGWRLVTRLDIDEHGILPEHDLSLGADVRRRLPAGRYRLRGDLWVDGRRVSPLEKEIDFAGDPLAEDVAFDTALLLDPDTIKMEVSPGATRSTTVLVENPGDKPVNVRMDVTTPESLRGVEYGEVRGTDFSASEWTEIRPSEFTIRPGGRRNVRVLTLPPNNGVDRPNYYADLVLKGTYADGQSAGDTLTRLTVVNVEQEGEPAAQLDQLLLAEAADRSQYVVQTRLLNVGDVDIQPAAGFVLVGQDGQQMRSEIISEPGLLLPLGVRLISYVMDFSEVPTGTYVLRAVVEYASSLTTTRQMVVGVATAADGTRSVTVLDENAADMAPGDPAPAPD